MTGSEKAPAVCYLCAQPMLPGQPANADHIPPQQLMAPVVRQDAAADGIPIQLITRRVHSACNSSYHLDEEYFVQTLVPFLKDGNGPAGALYRKTIAEFHQGKNVPLVQRVKAQAINKVGSIYLPAWRMAYRIEGERFYRVAEKIVRGLHYVEFGEVLPMPLEMVFSITLPREKPPEHFELVMSMQDAPPSKGNHPGVFAYRHMSDNPGWNYWAMLFWDRILITAVFPRGEPPFGE